ncbi:hypothetical protein DFP72DRAFT_1071966 [Ephemerocybe angulata]|uniref:Uncharacterized protein n=1 Tax=Ephemerocybe angulata TaxID=980116 RepID=A0A8H6HQZ4_9AGAR|nr:hypothetical protein DFP72DRAFT_1071966 [Tulosesus angulatus]
MPSMVPYEKNENHTYNEKCAELSRQFIFLWCRNTPKTIAYDQLDEAKKQRFDKTEAIEISYFLEELKSLLETYISEILPSDLSRSAFHYSLPDLPKTRAFNNFRCTVALLKCGFDALHLPLTEDQDMILYFLTCDFFSALATRPEIAWIVDTAFSRVNSESTLGSLSFAINNPDGHPSYYSPEASSMVSHIQEALSKLESLGWRAITGDLSSGLDVDLSAEGLLTGFM